MSTVRIVKFNGNGTLDWDHGDGSAQDVNIGNLSHPDMGEGDIKTALDLECSTCNTKSTYPMSGGPISQQLHKEHLEADTLENVQADATERSIETDGKDKDTLIAEIIQNECDTKGVPYLL